MKTGSKASSPPFAIALLLLGGFAFAGAVSVTPRPQANRPKPKVTWGKDFDFYVTYGRPQILKPVVTPSSLARKMAWTVEQPTVLSILSFGENGYGDDDLYLNVFSRTDAVCEDAATIKPKLHGIEVGNFASGTILRPSSTTGSQFSIGVMCSDPGGGGHTKWAISLHTDDGGKPNFAGATLTESLQWVQSPNPCNNLDLDTLRTDNDQSTVGQNLVGSYWARDGGTTFLDRKDHCIPGIYPGPSCTSILSQSWSLGKCSTLPVNITIAFSGSSMTVTRGDGSFSVGPIGPRY